MNKSTGHRELLRAESRRANAENHCRTRFPMASDSEDDFAWISGRVRCEVTWLGTITSRPVVVR
jgi:hypothetical protein